MELQAGFEPTTCSLQVNCTTTMLLKRIGSPTGFEPATTSATNWRSSNWATDSILQSRKGNVSLRWRDSNPRSRMAADLQSALVAAGEHLNNCGALRSRTSFSGFSVLRIHHVCQVSIKVMRVGLEPTTGCSVDTYSDPIELPHHKSGSRRIRTFGAFWARHVSSVLVSTTHPYFLVWWCKVTIVGCSLFS